MCVILIGKASHILLHHVGKAMDANPHGVGVAWLDRSGHGRKIIRYLKGVDKEEDAKSLLTSLRDRQIVFHARIATAGGTLPSLTHPFPVEINPDLSLEGKTDLVLFQNGHVGDWERLRGDRYDRQAWSDSRAIAHGLAIGTVRNLTDPAVQGSKFVMWSPDFLGYYPKKAWSFVKGGVLASNRDFINPIWIRSAYKSWDYSSSRYNPSAMRGMDSYEGYGSMEDWDDACVKSYRNGKTRHWRGHGYDVSATESANDAYTKWSAEEREKARKLVKEALADSAARDKLMADAIQRAEDKKVRDGKGSYTWPKDSKLPIQYVYEKPDLDDITSEYLAARIAADEVEAREAAEGEGMKAADLLGGEPEPEWKQYDLNYDCSGQPIEDGE